MIIPKAAISKAIEGGWKKAVYEICDVCGGSGGAPPEYPCGLCHGRGELRDSPMWDYYEAYPEQIALDPSFWQSLGKALGWGNRDFVDPSEHFAQEEWEDNAHEFYDLILTGGDTENFWAELLS